VHPLIIVIILIAAMVFISWYKRASGPARKNALIYGGAGLLILLALTKGQWLMAALAGGIAAIQRIMTATQLFNRIRSMGGPTKGNESDVSTEFLDMSLDHDSGTLHGHVTQGQYQGCTLDNLALADLINLLAECSLSDQQSVTILETYLDRRFGIEWRKHSEANENTEVNSSQISRQEAFKILGITHTATREEIIEAHKRLMQRLHPDRGGSTYLAARINQAKDLLLG